MSFTDQRSQVVTDKDVKPGERFRCHLCGHKFAVGDVWRWVYSCGHALPNFITCFACDGPDVLNKWVAANEEARRRFWWLYMDIEDACDGAEHAQNRAYESGYEAGFHEGRLAGDM